jgi:prophage regulatory protein
MERTGLSKTHVYRLMGRGKFPQQTKLSARLVVWDSDQIADWISLQLATPMGLAA